MMFIIINLNARTKWSLIVWSYPILCFIMCHTFYILGRRKIYLSKDKIFWLWPWSNLYLLWCA